MQVVSSQGEGAPDETSWTTTLALESDTRFREEAAGVQAGRRSLVRDGERWASWDSDWGAVTSETEQEGGPPSSTYAFLLDPVGVLSPSCSSPWAAEVAGRDAWRVRAKARREPEASVLFRLGPGADRLDLAVDAERGALLQSEAFLGDEPFHRLEVAEITFGPSPSRRFDLTLPEGIVASGGWPRPQRLPLHELAAAAPFAVFVPDRVPEGWRLFERLFTAGRERPPVEPEVFLGYVSGEGASEVSVRQRSSSSTRAEWLDWQPGDEGLEVADAGENVEPRHHVRRRGGTFVRLSGADRMLLISWHARSSLRPRRRRASSRRGERKPRCYDAPRYAQPAEALPGALVPALEEHLLDRESIARARLHGDARDHERVRRHVQAPDGLHQARAREVLSGLLQGFDEREAHAIPYTWYASFGFALAHTAS